MNKELADQQLQTILDKPTKRQFFKLPWGDHINRERVIAVLRTGSTVELMVDVGGAEANCIYQQACSQTEAEAWVQEIVEKLG